MFYKHRAILGISFLAVLALASGCTSAPGPRILPASNFGPSIHVDQLIKEMDAYHVWVVFDPRPTAVFFDPKDDLHTLTIKEPILTHRKVTDPARLHRHIVDLDDRLPYPLEYVDALSIPDNGRRISVGYAYVWRAGDVSIRSNPNNPNELVIARVLPLERPRLGRHNLRFGDD